MNKKIKATDFDEYLAKELKNKEFKKLYNSYDLQLRISYKGCNSSSDSPGFPPSFDRARDKSRE